MVVLKMGQAARLLLSLRSTKTTITVLVLMTRLLSMAVLSSLKTAPKYIGAALRLPATTQIQPPRL